MKYDNNTINLFLTIYIVKNELMKYDNNTIKFIKLEVYYNMKSK